MNKERTSFGSAQGAPEERPDGRGRWSAKRKTAAVLRILSGEDIMRLPHDHGSQYMSDDFRAEIAFLGMESSPAFVRQPEGNGCAERFISHAEGAVALGENFSDGGGVAAGPAESPKRYTQRWIVQHHGYLTPQQARQQLLAQRAAA